MSKLLSKEALDHIEKCHGQHHGRELLEHIKAQDQRIHEWREVAEEMRNQLGYVLPLAKGYAYEHQVGRNMYLAQNAQALHQAAGLRMMYLDASSETVVDTGPGPVAD